MSTTESAPGLPRGAATGIAHHETGTARDAGGPGRGGWWVVGAAAAWIAAVMLLEWPAPFRETFNSSSYRIDSSVFAYAGELLRGGGTPYVSYWDHKPPLIHLVNAAGLVLSGGQLWGIWLVCLATLLAAVVLAYMATDRAFGRVGAMLGVGYFVIALTGVRAFNLTEPYTLPIAWAAALLVVRWSPGEERRYFRIGCMLGVPTALQFLFRPNLIGAGVSVGLVFSIVLLSGRRMGAWLRFVGGGISGLIVVGAVLVAWLAREGAVQPFLEQVFQYNFQYSSTTLNARIRSVFSGIEYATQYGTLLLPFPGWLFAVYRVWKGGRRDPLYPVFLLGVVWLPVELLLASTSGRAFDHYFIPVLSPLAFLSALFASSLLSSGRERLSEARIVWGRRTVLAVLAAMAVPAAWDLAMAQREAPWAQARSAQVASTVGSVRAHSRPGDAILVWGNAAEIYFLADRRAASRFIYRAPLVTPGFADSALVRGFIHELQVTKPALIVDANSDQEPSLRRWNPDWRFPAEGSLVWWSMTPALRDFYDLVAANYTMVDSAGPQGWAVYRRTASASPAGAGPGAAP